MQQEKIKNLLVNVITGAVVVGLIYAAYFVFTKSSSGPADTTVAPELSVAKIAEETAIVGVEIDRTVSSLKDLKRTVANSKVIFDLPAFQNLQDFSVAIPEEPLGRPNPFVPTEWKLKMKALEEAASKSAPTPSASTAPQSTASAPASSSQSSQSSQSGI